MAESDTRGRAPESRREWLTVREVAVRLRVSECTARRRMRPTSLMAKFLGGRVGYRIRPADLQRFLRGPFGRHDSRLTAG